MFDVGDKLDQSRENHDRKVKVLLQWCCKKRIKLSKEKIQLKESEMSLIGHFVNHDSLLPDTTKIDAVTKLQSPTSLEGVLWKHKMPCKVSFDD